MTPIRKEKQSSCFLQEVLFLSATFTVMSPQLLLQSCQQLRCGEAVTLIWRSLATVNDSICKVSRLPSKWYHLCKTQCRDHATTAIKRSVLADWLLLNQDEITPPEFFSGSRSNEMISMKRFQTRLFLFYCHGIHVCPAGLFGHLFVFRHLYIFILNTATRCFMGLSWNRCSHVHF